MKYVVHRRFKDKAICGEVNLPAMTICEETNGYIFHGDKLLCVVTSENAHQFFARDDDGAGMLRGKLCAFYLNLCKSDHSAGGITFESAKAKGFVEDPSWESPAI